MEEVMRLFAAVVGVVLVATAAFGADVHKGSLVDGAGHSLVGVANHVEMVKDTIDVCEAATVACPTTYGDSVVVWTTTGVPLDLDLWSSTAGTGSVMYFQFYEQDARSASATSPQAFSWGPVLVRTPSVDGTFNLDVEMELALWETLRVWTECSAGTGATAVIGLESRTMGE